MKRFHFFVGLLSVFALYLIGCPAASTQPATLAPEPVAASTTASPEPSPPADPFVPRSPLDDLQVSTPPKAEDAESREHGSRLREEPPKTVAEAPKAESREHSSRLVKETPKTAWDTLPTEQDSAKSLLETPQSFAEPMKVEPETSKPVVEPPKVEQETSKPVVEPPKVEQETSKPVVEPPKVEQETSKPVVEPPKVEDRKPKTEPAESAWAPATSSFADAPATPVPAEPAPPQSFAEPVAETPAPTTSTPTVLPEPAKETPKTDTAPPEPSSRLVEEKSVGKTTNHEPRTTNHEPNTQPYDPIKVNGEYFVDWPRPKALLVFTGFMNGYVEPCGCAGIEQMKGGLSRRRTFLQELDKRDWPVIPIDAGNLNKGFGLQEELKYNIVIDESLRQMKYNIVGLGNRELLFPTDVLILYCVDVPGSPRRYTSANIRLLDDPDCMASFRTETKNGVKIGVISVIGESAFGEVNNQDVKRLDIVERLREVLPKFDAENCNQRVLIVHGTNAEFQSVLKAFPNRFEFALCSDGPAEPPAEPQWINNTMNVEVGEKGKYAVAVGLFDDVDHPMRYQRVALDSRFKNAADVMEAMQFYQDQLKKSGLKGLGIKAIPNRQAAENGIYVGSKACADCHEPSMKIWKKSGHAHAWKTLVETSKPPRNFDPECIACHAVGWSPAEFLPFENGFMGEKETPQLIDVGCESCHGPGEKHVAAEKGADDSLKQKLRKAVRLPLEGNAARKLCIECHDGDNSPHFDFDTYWPKIEHKESTP